MQRLVFGEYDGTNSARVQALFEACQKAGIDAVVSDAIERSIWEKFVLLVGLSATTASTRKGIGPIRENPQTRAFLLGLMREVVVVGRAKGVPLREDFAEDRLAFADTLPPDMKASMCHDLERGNRLELPWLSGGVARLGDELGVPTPLNHAVADVLVLHEAGKA
jgi:2-dehydropantoate 2-reductase